jgi:hypothetical protein
MSATISPVSVEATRVTNAHPDTLGCTDPGGARYFLPRDLTAAMWFSVAGAVAGDLAAAEFIAPDGSLYDRVEWDPLESGGSWCMWTWIDINGSDAERMFGTWNVRVSWNGARVISQTFQILPVDVTGFMLTRQTVTDSLCSTPIPNTTFLTTDPQAHLWFTLELANAGDVAEVQWLDPRGVLAARSNFAPLSAGGGWCFASTLLISGQNRAPGQWTTRALWNGTEVGRTTFQIERPGNEAPSAPSNSVTAAALADPPAKTLTRLPIGPAGELPPHGSKEVRRPPAPFASNSRPAVKLPAEALAPGFRSIDGPKIVRSKNTRC